MQVSKVNNNNLINYTIIYVLFIFLCLSQVLSATAQKKPPVLGTNDNDPSAFNKQTISKLQEEYDANVRQNDSDSQEKARQIRNRLIAIGIDQTDAYFFNYLKSERHGRERLQFLLDFLEIGAAVAISITNGERAKTIISEGLGALQASRISLNKNFKLLERQILINQMIADRGEILTLILGKMEKGVSTYSWEAARADLRTYFNAGTLDSALSRLSATTGNAAETAEAKVRRFKGKNIIGPPTADQKKSSEDAEDNKSALEDAVNDIPDNSKEAAALKSLKSIVEKLEEDEEIHDRMITVGISPAPDNAKKIFDGLITIATDLTNDNRRDLVKKIDEAFAKFGKIQ